MLDLIQITTRATVSKFNEMLYGYATKSREKREKEGKDTVETGKILGESESRVKQNKKRPTWTIVCVCTYVCMYIYV